MRAARLHEVGAPFVIDSIPIPEPRDNDVRVRVQACNLVPNLRNVVTHYSTWFPYLPLPPLPAIYGLDAAGVVDSVGPRVRQLAPGDRVYVNPARSCGSCAACRRQQPTQCEAFTFQGYFGFGPGSSDVFKDYPYGGLADFMTAPASSIVKIAGSTSFEGAARFGYIGTGYSALRKAQAGPGTSVIITGATGTLGVSTVLVALALGVPKILAVARNRTLLERLKSLAPGRIEVLPHSKEGPAIDEWARTHTDGVGADVLIESLSTGASAAVTLGALQGLRKGGVGVCIGGMSEDLAINPIWFMTRELSWRGSVWFSTAEGEDLAAMAGSGLLDLSVFDHRRFPLSDVNAALDATQNDAGGFANVTVMPGMA